MLEKGFAPITVIIVIIGLIGGGLLISKKVQLPITNYQTKPQVSDSPSATDSAKPAQSSIPSSKPTKTSFVTKAPTPTSKPSATVTPSPTSTIISNPYDLNSATGSVKVLVKPQTGELGFTPQAELSTISGFKVLDGRSTDKITQFGPNRTDSLRGEIIFSTAPPGPYKVRISYNGSWSDQKDVTVASAKQSTVEFTVAGVAPTPTSTPRPKPICNVLVMPSSTGTAPFEASVCVGNQSNPYQAVQKEFADYDGNGSWDYEGNQYGCHSYTFQSAGTYTPKAKIIGTSGDESDVCQTSVTIN